MHKLFRIKRFVTALSLIAVLLSACSSNAKSALPTPTRLPLSVEEQNKADYIEIRVEKKEVTTIHFQGKKLEKINPNGKN